MVATDRVRSPYEADAGRLWKAVYGYSRRSDIADDAVAEAFAQVLRRGDAVHDVRKWVWRAAFRIAAGQLQAGGRDVELTTEVEQCDEHLVELLDDLAGLSDQQRRCALLRYVGGYTPAEIADVLGTSSAVVRVQLHRARAALATTTMDR